MKKVKYYLIAICALIILGMIIGFKIMENKNKSKEISLSGPVIGNKIEDAREIIKRLRLQESAIQKFKSSQELIVFETDLTQTITWDESWGNMDIFKKLQEINFYGKAIYTTDLSKLDNINFLHNQKKIYIHANKPQLKLIELDESKTTYSLPEKGLFRFGDIKLTAPQHQMITQEVKSKMKEDLIGTDIYNKAIISAEMSLKDLFNKIILNTEFKNYDILILWE